MNKLLANLINLLDEHMPKKEIRISRPTEWSLLVEIISEMKEPDEASPKKLGLIPEETLPEPLLSMYLVNQAIINGLPVSSPVRAALELIKKAATSFEKK